MENAMQLAGEGPAVGRPAGLRIASVITAIALVFAMFVLVQDRAEAAPSGASVAAAVALPSVDGVSAQLDFRSIVCPLLARLVAGPLGAFIAPIIAALRASFGCPPISPGA